MGKHNNNTNDFPCIFGLNKMNKLIFKHILFYEIRIYCVSF